MNIALPVILIVLTLLLAPGHAQAAPETFDLPPDFFPIMPWDGHRGLPPLADGSSVLKSIADCNFTIAGFVQPSDLPECEKLGLKAIIAGPLDLPPWKGKWQGVTDEQIEAAMKSRIAEAGKSSAVLGYYLVDEPGAPRFPALAKGVAAVKKHAPGKLAYINLFPGYATIGAPDQSQLGAESFTGYLEQYVATVKPQMLSYDDYMVLYSDNFQEPGQGAMYYRDLLEVRRVALKHGVPFWNTVSSNRIRPYTVAPSPANLMFQAYTTLAAGGRGLAWYTYSDRGYGYAPVSASGHLTETWQYLRMVNAQVKTLGPLMMKLESTGVFFTEPPVEGMPLLPGRLIRTLKSQSSLKGYSQIQPPLMLGEFKSQDGRDYVMIVNLSLERSANVTFETAGAARPAEVISAVDASASPFDEKNGQWLAPGQGVLLRLRNYSEVYPAPGKRG